ncbi:ADP-heptose:LPS heptosyltransferase [Mucilaginibacter sp. UYNi724]
MEKQNRNLFRLSRVILLKLPKLLRFFARFRKPAKRLLLIKTDAIGDYILFRNFIEVTKKSTKYWDHQIDLLGNILWEDVCLNFDKHLLNDTYFVKPDSFYYAPLALFKLGWRLFLNNYEVVLQPTYTRNFINDGFAGLAAAKQTIGFQSDNEGIEARYKNKTDKFYSLKLQLPPGVYHEFHRTRFFFETVLTQSISLSAPSITTSGVKSGIAVQPGAGVFKRGWEKEKLLELIQLIINNTTQQVYLLGGPSEVEIGEYLMQHNAPGSVTNHINTTSLSQTIRLISNSALLIANDTGVIHMAVAAQTPSVCILGGGHFGRFVPYPADAAGKPVCVYEKLPCYYCNWLCIFETGALQPFPCIAAVSVDNVWQATLPLLPNNSI